MIVSLLTTRVRACLPRMQADGMEEWENGSLHCQGRNRFQVLRRPARKFPVFSHIPAKEHSTASPHHHMMRRTSLDQQRSGDWYLFPSTPGDGLGFRLAPMQTAPAALIIRVNDAGI